MVWRRRTGKWILVLFGLVAVAVAGLVGPRIWDSLSYERRSIELSEGRRAVLKIGRFGDHPFCCISIMAPEGEQLVEFTFEKGGQAGEKLLVDGVPPSRHRGNYRNGKRHGVWTFWKPDGSINCQLKWADGRLLDWKPHAPWWGA
ncbi:MAG: hypothetical protein ACE5GW_06745 [Planctomycetota bacterium]